MLKELTTQPLGLEFGSKFSNVLMEHETHNRVASGPETFNSLQKEESVVENFPEQYANTQSQSINYAFTVRRSLLDGEESLKKVDSFSRWITKELEEVDDLHMQSSPGISWSADECGHVIDDSSLSPSLSHDQLFSINDFSPNWAYAESETEVLLKYLIFSDHENI